MQHSAILVAIHESRFNAVMLSVMQNSVMMKQWLSLALRCIIITYTEYIKIQHRKLRNSQKERNSSVSIHILHKSDTFILVIIYHTLISLTVTFCILMKWMAVMYICYGIVWPNFKTPRALPKVTSSSGHSPLILPPKLNSESNSTNLQ